MKINNATKIAIHPNAVAAYDAEYGAYAFSHLQIAHDGSVNYINPKRDTWQCWSGDGQRTIVVFPGHER